MNQTEYFAHSHALVEEGAVIGSETRIWAFAHVMNGAQVGRSCNIGGYSFIERGAYLGDQVTVKNGVQIWEGIVAENGVFFGPNCVLTNHPSPRAFIKQPKEKWLKKTYIREGATLGANSTVVCGITIGRFAFIAAGAVVTRDVPDFALMVGVPARRKGWVCKCAAQLILNSSQVKCTQCDLCYKVHDLALSTESIELVAE